MKVFKFGGASVKDAEAVRNVAGIMKRFRGEPVVVVVSAMGKTTNALEALTASFFYKKGDTRQHYEEIQAYHTAIMEDLFPDKQHPVYDEVNNLFVEIEWFIKGKPIDTYNYLYDQIVCIGELVSTKIVSAYLVQEDLAAYWLDARGLVRTDDYYREARVQWDATNRLISRKVKPLLKKGFVITQGFIGGTQNNESTTMGREGSDYTAAIFGHVLDAEEVRVWKDVPGILNADPRVFDFAEKIARLSYYEAIEMTYYGAKVLHPKTMKPLENKQIPLQVRSFMEPRKVGTIIERTGHTDKLPPILIQMPNQILLTLRTTDLSFITEKHLSIIYTAFDRFYTKINMMQVSAVNFSACVDNRPRRIKQVLDTLEKHFDVRQNIGLELLTIRHYTGAFTDKLLKGRKVFLEQRTRSTVQFVVQ